MFCHAKRKKRKTDPTIANNVSDDVYDEGKLLADLVFILF